jgi:threonyl-tRNA synthetase
MILLPITDRANAMAEKIAAQAHALGIRAELDLRNEKVNAKSEMLNYKKFPTWSFWGTEKSRQGRWL